MPKVYAFEAHLVRCECGWAFRGSSQTRSETALRRHKRKCPASRKDRRLKLEEKSRLKKWQKLPTRWDLILSDWGNF